MRRTNVLMVEDEVLISELISEVLCDNGFDVHAVTNGETALRYLDDRAGSGRAVHRHQSGRPHGRLDAGQAGARAPARNADRLLFGALFASALAPLVSRSVFLRKPYNPVELCTLLTRLTSTEH